MQTQKVTGYHVGMFIICWLSTAFAGTVSTLMSVYLPVAVKDLLGERDLTELDNISAYINSVFIFGGAFGGLLSGVLGDRLGRKTAVISSVVCYGLFTVLTGYMTHWGGVVVCRFCSGMGLGGVLVTTTTLVMEEWPEKTRAIMMGILSISIPVGIFSAGLIDYVVPSWREGFLVGLIPMAIAVISLWALRESAKWKEDRTGGESVPASALFAPAQRSDLVMGSLIFGSMLIGLWAIFSWLPTWIQSLAPGADTQKERGLSMMMMGMGGLAGGFLSGWLVNGIGLRKSMILCFAASAVLSCILFKTNHSITTLMFSEIGILSLFFGASQGVLSVYIPSLFPVAMRATATGFCFNVGRIFTATAVLFIGVLVSALGGYGNSLFIFSLVFIIGLGATLKIKPI